MTDLLTARLWTLELDNLVEAATLLEESGFDFVHVGKNDRGLEEAVARDLSALDVDNIVDLLTDGEEEGLLDFTFNLETK